MATIYDIIVANVALLDAIGVVYVIIQFIFGIPEIFGKRIHFTRPFIRPNYVRWNATDVAIVGLCAALTTSLAVILGQFPLMPGLPAGHWGWVAYRSFEPLFAIAFGVPALIAFAIANTLIDLFTGSLAMWTITGVAYALWFPMLLFRWAGNDAKKFLRTKKTLAAYGAWLVLYNITKLFGPAAFASIFKLVAPEVAWIFFGFAFGILGNPLAIVPNVIGFFIITPILFSVLPPVLERYGLLSKQRHVPREGTTETSNA